MNAAERFTDWGAGVVVIATSAAPLELFRLGQFVATPGAIAAFQRNPTVGMWDYLKRHVTGDWGDLSAADRAENELSLREGFRLLSAYHLPDGTRIWIITEADRSATTLLLPDEY